uniref:Uncharacterized protein n=1 Tax=Glycine max TaxID=3847 RepID=A0A0R0G5Q6_SOYBN
MYKSRSRSRLTISFSCYDAAFSTRCSPTIPLFWSADDSYEDCSRRRRHHHHAAISKVLSL